MGARVRAANGVRRAGGWWCGLALMVPACTLDFDEFKGSGNTQDVVFVDAAPPPDAAPDRIQLRDAASDVDRSDAATLDRDSDGHPDSSDNCPDLPNADQADLDEDQLGDVCDPDRDGDGIANEADNCPDVVNASQGDLDRNDVGDECDDDIDGDGVTNALEEEAGTDPRRVDSDGDDHLDGDDRCPLRPDRLDLDSDSDGHGNACDPDDDGDGIADWQDNCPGTANGDQVDADGDGRGDMCANDADGDGVVDANDNCPTWHNPNQSRVPCVGRFEIVPYNRDVRALIIRNGQPSAGTAGGIVELTPEGARALTNADGLPGNEVRALVADEQGRVWATTDRGLAVIRPDGFLFSIHPADEGGGPEGDLRAVAVSSDGVVWVSSDSGVNQLQNDTWSVIGADLLPSIDVRGLWVDPVGRLWIATAAGVVRWVDGAVDATFAGYGDIGDGFLSVAGDADDTVWLLGENGAVHLQADDVVAPWGIYAGFEARALAPTPAGDRYVASAEGLRRIDRDGRLMPAGSALLPSPDVRSVVAQPDGPRWVGTADGLLAVDSFFSTFGPGETTFGSPCVNAVVRARGIIWVGTARGLYKLLPEGTFEPVPLDQLPGEDVQVIRRIGEEIWVGTDLGIGVFGIAGGALRTYGAADGIPTGPISDIVAGRPNDVWVSGAGTGIARLRGAIWTRFSESTSRPNFISDQVRALAHDGDGLWIGSSAGLMRFVEDAAADEDPFAPPITERPELPSPDVADLVVAAGRLYVATALGLAIRESEGGQWTTLRRASEDWPLATGSDNVRAVAHDGEHVWILLASSGAQSAGSLIRRRELPGPGGRLDPQTMMYTWETADLPPIEGTRLDVTEGELLLSFCGAPDRPGGFTVLDGGGVVVADPGHELGLPDGETPHLSLEPAGDALFATVAEGIPRAFRLLPAGSVEPFFLPPNVGGTPHHCETAPGSDQMWCVIEGVGVGRRMDDTSQWSVISRSAFGGSDVRDIAVLGDRVVWLATSRGLFFVNDGGVASYNVAGTGAGLPDDDVRVVLASSEGVIYAGTARGVGIFDASRPEEDTWTTIGVESGALENGDVRSMALDADGVLWMGTMGGLYRRALNGEISMYDQRDGLPSSEVNSVAVHPDGRIFIGTRDGLAVGTMDGGDMELESLGFVDGLPGETIWDVTIAAAGQVWMRSQDGVALLREPLPEPDAGPVADAGLQEPDVGVDAPDGGL